MSIQALRDERADIGKKVKALVDPARKWDKVSDQPIYDAYIARVEEIDAAIERITASNQMLFDDAANGNALDNLGRIGHISGANAKSVFNKWLREGDRSLNADDWQVIRNTMSTTTNSEGGFTVATEIATTVLDALKKFGGIRAVADVIQTATGNPLNFPTSDGTSEEGEIVAENGSASDLDIAFGTVALNAYKYSSKVVSVPIELLMDSNVDIEAFVRNRVVTRLGRITNKHFTLGTGSSQPRGIITAAGTGITAANSTSQVTAVKYDSLVDLQHSVDPAYRELGNCRWMFNDNTLKSVRKIVDSQSRPIFVPGYEMGVPGGAPDMLLGSPIQINQSMADMAASAKSIAYGDFKFYTIRDVMAVELQRYTDSAYAKKGQVGFLAWLRSGGNFVDVGGAVKLFVNAAS